MENIKPFQPARTDTPRVTENTAQQPHGMTGTTALHTQGMPASQQHAPTPLSTRHIAVSDRYTVQQLALPLPSCLEEQPFANRFMQTFTGPSDDDKQQVKDTASAILLNMGASALEVTKVVGKLDHSERERLCRLFCGDDATVLISREPQQAADFIVLAKCADIPLLQKLAELLPNEPIAANLLCATMLTLRDTPQQAAGLLKAYCQLIRTSSQPLPAPPMSLKGMIDLVLERQAKLLTAGEAYALQKQFENVAVGEPDPVKKKAFTASAQTFAAETATRVSDALSTGDSAQVEELRLRVMSELVMDGTAKISRPATILQDHARKAAATAYGEFGEPSPSPDPTQAQAAAASAYEDVADYLPEVGRAANDYYCKERAQDATDEHGTLHPDTLKEYLKLAARAPGFMHPKLFDAFIRYGTAQPDTPFTPQAIRSLWFEFHHANPVENTDVLSIWLDNVKVDDPENVPASGVNLSSLIARLPSQEELQTVVRWSMGLDPSKALKTLQVISAALKQTMANLLKHLQSTPDLGIKEAWEQAIGTAQGAVAGTIHRAYAQILASGVPLTAKDLEEMIPPPDEAILLPQAHHVALLEAMLQQLPVESIGLVANLASMLPDQRLQVLAQALKLDAQNCPLAEILEHVRKGIAGSATSSDAALVLSSTLIARLMSRKLSDENCKLLAELALALVVLKLDEKLTVDLTRFFKQINSRFPPVLGSKADRPLGYATRLERGLLILALEALKSAPPAKQREAMIALAACYAGRALLHPHVIETNVGKEPTGYLSAPSPSVHDASNLVRRVNEGYFYLCLHDYFAAVADPDLRARKLDKCYLRSAFDEIWLCWRIPSEYHAPRTLDDHELQLLRELVAAAAAGNVVFAVHGQAEAYRTVREILG